MEKQDFRTISEAARIVIRENAIRLIKSGKKKKEVAQICGVKPGTITDWVKKHKESGRNGLKAKRKGAISEDKKLLSSVHEKQIQKLIIDKMPDQYKLDFGLWTRKAVKELVERELGIVLAINHCYGIFLDL